MEETSEIFKMAYSTQHYNKEQAIKLYDEEIRDNPENLSALNNRGLAYGDLAKEKKDETLLEKGKEDLKQAIFLMDTKETYKNYSRPNGLDTNLEYLNNIKFE